LPALSAKESATPSRASASLSHVSETLSTLLNTWTTPPSTGLRTSLGTTYEFFDEVPGPAVAPPRTSDVAALLRLGAVAIDVLLLVVLDLLLLRLISLSSDIPVAALLRESGWAVAALCVIPMALYFLLFGGIGGSTVGRYACSLAAPTAEHPLTLADILRRAVIGR
jgi:hypothetical protein